MGRGGRHWDGTGLERKIRAAGRPWVMGDIAMVAEGQWAVRTTTTRGENSPVPGQETVAADRLTDGRRPQPIGEDVALTVEELARTVGARLPDARRDQAAE